MQIGIFIDQGIFFVQKMQKNKGQNENLTIKNGFTDFLFKQHSVKILRKHKIEVFFQEKTQENCFQIIKNSAYSCEILRFLE